MWKRLVAQVPLKPLKFLPEPVFPVGKLRHSRLASRLPHGRQTQGTCKRGTHTAHACGLRPRPQAYLHGCSAVGPDLTLESQSF